MSLLNESPEAFEFFALDMIPTDLYWPEPLSEAPLFQFGVSRQRIYVPRPTKFLGRRISLQTKVTKRGGLGIGSCRCSLDVLNVTGPRRRR